MQIDDKSGIFKNITVMNMMKCFRGIMMIAAMAVAFSADAKLKGLPMIKSYKDYNFKKPVVESLKYTVYAPKIDGENITKGKIVDFVAEIFFDDKGNRVKEIVYNIESGEVDVIITWQYNETVGTVIETRTDANGKLLARTEFLVNYSLNTVLVRRYQNIEDPVNNTVALNVLIYEELWTEDAKHKKVIYKKTYFDIRDGLAVKQSISEETMEKPYTLYIILESLTAPIDYTWLYDYNERSLKASSGKTKKEPIYDGSKYQYKAKSKLLDRVLHFGSDKKLKNETSFVYSFDEKKNWIEIIQKENNKPLFIVQRDIKYRF
jgi:hypothetical protein